LRVSPACGSLDKTMTDDATASAAAGEEAGHVTFRVCGVTKVYGTGEAAVWALRGVDLELFTGEMVVLHPSDRVADGTRITERTLD
jgi:hypothetical protein